jgi:hypothetical protein
MLEGSLETFPLASVVRLLDDTGQTGRLSVHAALGQGSISFEHGRLVAAAGAGSDPLEAALSLFDYQTGTFSFRVEEAGERTIDLDIPQFLGMAEEREALWAEIRSSIPQDATLVVVPLDAGDRADGEITVSTEAWKIAVLANGRTTAQIAARAGTSEFRTCSVLLELLQAGLVGLNGQAQPPSVRQRPEPVVQAPKPEHDEVSVEEASSSDEPELDPTDLLRELGESDAQPAPRRRLTRR